MLHKERRIPKAYFPYILKNGARYYSPHLLLYTAKIGNETEKSRFSFSISKKIAKSAVVRNKMRRRGYSIIGKNLMKFKNNHFMFFCFKKGCEKADFSALEAEIMTLISDFFV